MTKTAPPQPAMMRTTTIGGKGMKGKTPSPSSRCSDHGTFKFNCSKPSKEDPEQPCGKGCCTHRNPNNNSVFMKRRACKECKKLGEGGYDLCDLHFVDKRTCKKCAPRCKDHGKVKANCQSCRLEETNAVINLTSLSTDVVGLQEKEQRRERLNEEDFLEKESKNQTHKKSTKKKDKTILTASKTTLSPDLDPDPDVEIISAFETTQTLKRPKPTIGDVEWVSEDLTTTAKVSSISRAHPDFTIELCRKIMSTVGKEENVMLARQQLKKGETNIDISFTENDYGTYQYRLHLRRTGGKSA
ncbi:unnamed protein product [Bathycoccus prasinos]